MNALATQGSSVGTRLQVEPSGVKGTVCVVKMHRETQVAAGGFHQRLQRIATIGFMQNIGHPFLRKKIKKKVDTNRYTHK